MHPTHNQADPAITGPADSPSAVLRRAADYLERYGWTWGVSYHYTTRTVTHPAADVAGAIRIAVAGHPIIDHYDHPDQAAHVGRTLAALIRFLDLRSDYPTTSVIDWNDAVPANTPEVVQTLRDAADWCDTHAAAYGANYTAHLLGSAAGR